MPASMSDIIKTYKLVDPVNKILNPNNHVHRSTSMSDTIKLISGS